MKKQVILKSSILAVVAGFSIMATNQALADEIAVQFMGVNDFHGALETTGTARLEDQTVRNAGGAALLATYMDDAEATFKAENDAKDMPNTTIRVQAGDMVGASPANSALLQDEPTVKVFNQLDVEYGTLGNHEFDEGLDEFHRIVSGNAPETGKFNAIVDNYRHEAAKQEIVIANVVDKDTKQIPYNWKPYAIKEIPVNDKSVKVGFIGVITTEFPNLVLRKNHEQYNVLDEAETIAHYAKELNNQGVHAIVVLAHVAATSKDGVAAGPAAEMMEKVNKLYPENSVDLVFAGHNHVYTNGKVQNTLIVQSTSQGKAFANVQGVLDTDTADFVATPTATITAVDPTSGKTKNAAVQAIIDDANATVKKVTDAKIGTAAKAQTISRELNDQKESAVGDLVTAAQLDIARKSGYPNVDFAFTNNGGIRADLVVQSDGTITWGAAQAVQPFGNILQIVELTGDQIYRVLDQQYDEKELYFLQMAGIRYIYTKPADATEETPYRVYKAYKADGTEIDRNQTYTAVINDFLLGGGDGFSVFREAKLIGAIDPDTEVFIRYIEEQEKAHQPIMASILGNKRYQEVVFDTAEALVQPENPVLVIPEDVSDKETRDDKTTPTNTFKVPVTIGDKSSPQDGPAVETSSLLPETGDQSDQLVSSLLAAALLGSFGLTLSYKRKEEMD
ncbi:bifunctional metallophosphatase/5'-nucleotidase [Streptococcus sp. DD13]|uniref:bifunctional metallophosphatase/5'-nucleotidase n=1 Tax=Streptococcus sp. DD13 TaxID=1777881 RepID=UPI000794A1D6|nr:bifunctional metallophosphatase/5'-nucleotidase [Streptococcus sp. DD13]KXT78816.1 5'-nucleotidase [Streptococcus sp. DD13]